MFMFVIYIYVINIIVGCDVWMYQCLIYKKFRRMDLMYIVSVDLKINQNLDYWILCGVVLLCDIK